MSSDLSALVRSLAFPSAIACLFALGGCLGDGSTPTGPEPAGGGQERVLDFETFRTTVAPVLHERGCSAMGACHGGGIRGSFQLSPRAARDDAFDFAQAVDQVDDVDHEASALLRKPLAVDAGGSPHGVEAFASADDDDYVAILAWIRAGELRP